jgi:hypothetical protein
MYCIECGALIPDHSRLCPACGKSQIGVEQTEEEKIPELKEEKQITRKVIKARKSSIDTRFLRKTLVYYLVWVLIHTGLLLIAADSIPGHGDPNDRFWPFSTGSSVKNYDIREFLVYIIFPFVLLFIWSMIRAKTKENDFDPAEPNN